MRARGELIGRLTEGAANGRGDLQVVTVLGEKRLKLVDVPTAVAGDLARVRQEIEAAVDRREWPARGSIGTVEYDADAGQITDWTIDRARRSKRSKRSTTQ